MGEKKYIGKDLCGFDFNMKYPPTNGPYHGYKTDKEETLFYDFAVLGYDLSFTYKGKNYYFLTEDNYVANCDETFNIEYERFEDAIDALENFTIDGKTLVDLIDELESCQPE